VRSSRPDSIVQGANSKADNDSVPAGAGSVAKHFAADSECPPIVPIRRHENDRAASMNVLNRPSKFRHLEIPKMLPVAEESIPNVLSAMGAPIEVVLVEDEAGMRWFLPRILDRSGEFRCKGCYESAEEAIREIPRVGAELVLMSIQLPVMSGIDCMRRLRSLLPRLGVVLVSALADLQIMSDAVKAGADGYLIKPFAIAQCLATLRLATRRQRAGESFEVALPSARRGDGCVRLTPREDEAMRWVAKGLFDKEIADHMGISACTVRKQLRGIFNKLNAGSRTEAARKFYGTEHA